MEPVIQVEALAKTYRVPQREAGLKASLRSLFAPVYQAVEAVHPIDFTIDSGEMVGFIGPNGAGKTTTLKMLSGLLYPTSGTARVAGYIPWERDPAYLARISMVMGNRSQMIWDIPPMDSFRVLSEIYRVPPADFRRNIDELIGLLDMGDLLKKPVRNLSLGERMKCELAAGLLYHPTLLFLDEPTLGLDVSMQRRFRQFLKSYNQRHEVTVILTSHYMADVSELCPRVILIHHGRKLYDGALHTLSETLAPYKLIKVAVNAQSEEGGWLASLRQHAEVIETENGKVTLRVPRADTPAMAAYVLENLPVMDLSVENPPLEAVVDMIYQEGAV
ncbi:MAG: ATP-binding cassette domain-containing protein [Anaerolineae bacterium]|nr:ATP-binding cassette domain-containing protein [Anaerolineae bacterium]